MSDPHDKDTPPAWRQDFPVKWTDDAYITRREFTKFLGLTSVGLLLGTFYAAFQRLWRRSLDGKHPGTLAAKIDEIPVGGYKQFHHPTKEDPCILLRLESDKFVAFNQRCTHLSCPVHFQASTRKLVCPCHEGFFNAETGAVLAGPPKRSLPRFAVELRDDQVWVSSKEVTA